MIGTVVIEGGHSPHARQSRSQIPSSAQNQSKDRREENEPASATGAAQILTSLLLCEMKPRLATNNFQIMFLAQLRI
jgi:hypothetical protein